MLREISFVFYYLFIISLILHLLLHNYGEETISKILLKDTFFSPFSKLSLYSKSFLYNIFSLSILYLKSKKRFIKNAKPLNVIICENLIGADSYLKNLIKEQIPEYSDRIDKEIGFIEASIGRMVPALSEEKRQGNPLRVAVEPYNILPVDKDAFKGEIPEVKNLYPFSPFSLFIQRKLFMHNMSHALCAYLGYQRNYEYIYQAVADYDIKYVALNALCQSALAVAKETQMASVPLYLRNAPTKLMAELGYSDGYKYAHGYPGHFADLEFMPAELAGHKFYEPADNKQEEGLRARLEGLWPKYYGK